MGRSKIIKGQRNGEREVKVGEMEMRLEIYFEVYFWKSLGPSSFLLLINHLVNQDSYQGLDQFESKPNYANCCLRANSVM